jgi:aryl-alcohol dehydrogenase
VGQIAQAAVLRRRDEPFGVEEIELPTLDHGQVLVQIAGAGLCHTDLLVREGYIGGDMPFVLGHEGSGIVVEVGTGVSSIEVGDHVVLTFDSCGECISCLSGHPAYCETFAMRNFMGVGVGDVPTATTREGESVATRWFGQSSFSNFVVVTTRNAVVIDAELPIEIAGPLGCSIMTGAATVTNVLEMHPGDSLVVLGVGSVGLAGVMMAAAIGASRIVAVDLDQSRLAAAASLGATDLITAGDVELLAQTILETGGPVSGVLDTTGNPNAIAASLEAVGPRGTCAIVGHQREDLVLGPRKLSGGKCVTAVYEGDAVPQVEIPRLASLWKRGQLPLERLVTSYAMSEVNEAERDIRSGAVIKPVLVP